MGALLIIDLHSVNVQEEAAAYNNHDKAKLFWITSF
jgi:hypothetical protein